MDRQSNWIGEARAVMRTADEDFFHVRPGRYWFDFALSLALAYGFGTAFLTAPLGSALQWLMFPPAVFWIYRLGSLVHEVCHLQHGEMRAFKVTWNLLVGVITLTPSPFFTRHHRDHHSRRYYGRREDPEYVVNFFRREELRSLIGYVLLIAVYPLLVFLRFALAPLTFLTPGLRRWVLRRASSLTMNARYVRKLNAFDRRSLTAIELLCWLRATAMLGAVAFGATHWTRLPLMYAIGLGVLVLNQLRPFSRSPFRKPRTPARFRRPHSRIVQPHGNRLPHLALVPVRHSLSCPAPLVSVAAVSQPGRRARLS